MRPTYWIGCQSFSSYDASTDRSSAIRKETLRRLMRYRFRMTVEKWPFHQQVRTATCLLVGNSFFALHDAADGVAFLAATLQYGLHLLKLVRGHDQDHADPHVEGAQHLVLGNVADLLQVFEDGRHRPGVDLDDRADALGQSAWQVSVMPPPVMWAIAETASASIIRRM